jgi:hypothetical protein
VSRVPLVGGFYKAPSVLAGAQRCLNLYPELNQKDAPYPYTMYLTPGLTAHADGPVAAWRGLYPASTGDLYGVCGSQVFYIDGAFNLHLLGSIGSTIGQVSMSDNRLAIVLVDGTSSGYVIDPATRTLQTINAGDSGAFYGADRVRYVDTFFAFNRPQSNQWYISLAEVDVGMLTGGPVVAGTITGGSGYANGVHAGVNLTGGTGTEVSADVTVSGGAVTAVAVTVGGSAYRVGDALSAVAADLGGAVATGAITPGSGYAAGVHAGVALTGGTGSGAVATVTTAGGVVTVVAITSAGSGYLVGDVLTAPASSLGGVGSGFVWAVSTLAAAGTGFLYTLTEVGSSAFDPLDVAAKVGGQDGISTLEIVHKDVWLLGDQNTSEIWYLVGGADFAFDRMPGVFIEHGCVAKNSVSKTDLFLFWLGTDKEGQLMAFMGENYQALAISDPAVHNEWAKYARVDDAIGAVYQQRDHAFYVLTFPSADRTWVYDLREKLWHERAWCDDNGVEHRIRPNCMTAAYGKIIAGDWQNGKLYTLDLNAYTDDGQSIIRRRGFPHLTADGKRVSYESLQLAMGGGEATGLLTTESPEVSLRYSYSRGASWGDPMTKPVGSTGQYTSYPTFWQLGHGRDAVFEVFWDFPSNISLQGAWIEAKVLAS